MPKTVGPVLDMSMLSFGSCTFGYQQSSGFGLFQFFGLKNTPWKLHGISFQVIHVHLILLDGFGGSGCQKKFLMKSKQKKFHSD